MAGTLSLQGIVVAQSNFHVNVFGAASLRVPYLVPQFAGFLLFLIGMQAELTQTPFDMPVAESELVAGYQTEYTGIPFLLFYMGEFGASFGLAAIAATLFLGGWYIPGLINGHSLIDNLIGFVVLFGKTMAVAFFIFWIRFSVPRLREDQLQRFAWTVLIPLSLANIALTGLFKVVF